ncbi:MAG: type VII toxin-antitoxin system MntA family adenylyltransferase antitoxin [Actinomycetota bacterium]
MVLSDADIVAAVRAVLPDARAITLFGSRAGDDARDDSDLDLAVLLPGPADPVRLWEAGEAVARRLDVDVDLVDLLAASTVLQHQVVTTGRRLFADGPEIERYEAFVLAEMTSLDEARAPLLADIRREGHVHGR